MGLEPRGNGLPEVCRVVRASACTRLSDSTQVMKRDRNLPVITKHDRRSANGGEHEAVETEALSQGDRGDRT